MLVPSTTRFVPSGARDTECPDTVAPGAPPVSVTLPRIWTGVVFPSLPMTLLDGPAVIETPGARLTTPGAPIEEGEREDAGTVLVLPFCATTMFPEGSAERVAPFVVMGAPPAVSFCPLPRSRTGEALPSEPVIVEAAEGVMATPGASVIGDAGLDPCCCCGSCDIAAVEV